VFPSRSSITTGRSTPWGVSFLLASLCALPVASAQVEADTQVPTLQPFSTARSSALPKPWRLVGLPGGKIPLTRIDLTSVDGAQVLRLETDKSYGNAVHDLDSLAVISGSKLRWRWRLEQALAAADLKRKDGDDTALKVCLMFDMSLDKLGLLERNLLRLARATSAEKLPAATLCYVWDHLASAGSEFPNAYTERLRFMVLDSGEAPLGRWRNHERDIVADFRRAFGHEADTIPPLIAVAVGADADNTGGASLAYVGDLTLTAPAATRQQAIPVKQ
jgi:hypothetical protein